MNKRMNTFRRFGLRTALVILTLLCVWLAAITHRARCQREALAVIQELRGSVRFDWELERRCSKLFQRLPFPTHTTACLSAAERSGGEAGATGSGVISVSITSDRAINGHMDGNSTSPLQEKTPDPFYSFPFILSVQLTLPFRLFLAWSQLQVVTFPLRSPTV